MPAIPVPGNRRAIFSGSEKESAIFEGSAKKNGDRVCVGRYRNRLGGAIRNVLLTSRK